MTNKSTELVANICESDVYMDNNEEYVIISKEISKDVLNTLRKGIIDLLREQNPITENKLSILFDKDVHEDLILLNHLSIITIQQIDSDAKHNIITLNRKVRIIEPDESED
jgi:hypothetical protein